MTEMYHCKCCDYNTDHAYNYDKHLRTLKHAKNIPRKQTTPFGCTICESYTTINKSNYTRHVKACIKREKQDKLEQDIKLAACPVQDAASSTSVSTEVLERIVDVQSKLVDRLNTIEQNLALCHTEQKIDIDSIVSVIKETVSQLKPTVIHNVNNGTIDNRMNINVFLNEHCKDAMNIMDFVKSIQLRHSDLDKFASLGYVNAMSNIMVNELNNLPLTQRPLHCTDVRRSTLHIKHDDAWHKEEKDSAILLRAIKTLRRLCNNMAYERFPRPSQIVENSVQDYLYTKIISEVTGGRGANNNDVYEKRNQKIVTSVCKSVKLNKTDMLSIKNAVPLLV